MGIELRGIQVVSRHGHKHCSVVVTKDHADMYVNHKVGVDINVNRGKILTFLGNFYGMEPGHVAWPHHVKVPHF